MVRVTSDISMSLDGFIAGPEDDVDQPLGEGGDRLHRWICGLESWRERHGLEGGEINRDAEIVDESLRNAGAFVMGRRMFELGEPCWGGNPPFRLPVFVLSHAPREPLRKQGGTTFTFVTDGIESALRQARAAAGGKDVAVMGGARTVQHFLAAGLLDVIQIHLVPVLLGEGRRLFDGNTTGHVELDCTRVVDSPDVTHLRFRVVRRSSGDAREGTREPCAAGHA